MTHAPHDTLPVSPRSALPAWMAIVPIGLLVLVAAFFGWGLTRDPHALPSTMIDRKMPDFSLAPLAPESPTLANADLLGRVSLVNVFGSWCSSCLAEHPELMEISRSGLVALHGVDWRDKPGDGAAWLSRFGNPYSRTGVDADSKLAIDLGVTGAPETFIIDRGGRIRYKQVGPITPELWSDTLLPIIRKLEAEPA